MSPLIVLSGVISLGMLMITAYVAMMRPRLHRCITAGDGKRMEITFLPRSIEIRQVGAQSAVRYAYADVAAQYWVENQYIIFLRSGGQRDVCIIPIDGDTFGDIYTVAASLEHYKKKMMRLKIKPKRSHV